jgi:hypothetical protein
LGGSVTIESGVGTATDSGAASLSTADAGVAGVSGNLSLRTGVATNGDSGSVVLASGSSSSGTGGDITLTVGSGTAEGGTFTVVGAASSGDAGGNINLYAGSSAVTSGGNIYLKPGAGSASGSVYYVDPSTSSNYGVISKSTLDFNGLTTASVSTSGTVDITSTTSITLTGGSGISMGDSYVHGFEKGTGTVGASYPTEVYLNTMTGKIISEVIALGSGSTDEITLHNTRITASSIVMVTVGLSPGCQVMVYQTIPAANWVDISVKNVAASACTGAYTLNFMVVN